MGKTILQKRFDEGFADSATSIQSEISSCSLQGHAPKIESICSENKATSSSNYCIKLFVQNSRLAGSRIKA